MTLFAAIRRWLDERFDWDDLIAPLRHKTVPTHRLSYWYFLGGITLFLFVIQVLTGILLLLYYRPGANEAFESVQYIMTRVQVWLADSFHPLLVGQSHDFYRLCAHVQRAVSQGLPQTSGS